MDSYRLVYRGNRAPSPRGDGTHMTIYSFPVVSTA
jgi:hypothetical protein